MQPEQIQPFDLKRLLVGEAPAMFLLEVGLRALITYVFYESATPGLALLPGLDEATYRDQFGEPAHVCRSCGFVVEEPDSEGDPGHPCPRCEKHVWERAARVAPLHEFVSP